MGCFAYKNLIIFIFAFVCGWITFCFAQNTGMAVEGQRLLATLAVIMVLWSTGCVSLGASCLLLLVLMTASISDFSGQGLSMGKAFRKSLAGFSAPVPMAVVAGTAFAAVIRATGLAERIVYGIMRAVAGKSGNATPGRILAAIFLADLPISFMIPAAIGRCAMYMAIAEGFERPLGFARLESGKPFNPFQKAVWIAVALVPIIMGGAFLTAAEATIMAGGFIQQSTGLPQYWATTFLVLYFPALGAMFVAWLVLRRLFPSNAGNMKASFITDHLKTLGPMSYKEKYCIGCLLAMVALFLTDTIHGAPAPLVLTFMCFVLFIPGVGAGNWRKEGKQIAWEGYFIIGVALGFSALLGEYKVMEYFAEKIALLNIRSFPLTLLVMIIATLLVRLGIASIASATALLVPISLVVATAARLSPEQVAAVAWITYVFCRLSFFLPHQGAHLIMTYAAGYFDTKDLFRAAVWITAGCAVIYFFWGAFCMEPILQAVR